MASPPGVITGGRVELGGRDLLGLDGEAMRRVRGAELGYVFQDPQSTLHPLLPVGDQVAEAVRAHQPISRKEAHQRAVRLLDLVRLPQARERARTYPHELSGGMRQRVGIAMAIANDAGVVVADEPTTALDVTVQAQVLKLLDGLRRERGMALLLITHDFGVISAVCDGVLVMYAGQIVEAGPAEAVLAAPAHPYTRRLIDCVPRLGQGQAALVAIPGQPPPAHRLPRGCAFADRCERAEEACRAAVPELIEVAEGRQVRCIKPLTADAA